MRAERLAPPPPELHPALRSKLTALARAAPGGWVARGRWLAIARFDEPWTTAMVHLEGVPAEAVYETPAFAEYIKSLHRLLAQSYAARGLALPPWRSWPALLRRWPPVAEQHRGAPPARVHILRPLPDSYEPWPPEPPHGRHRTPPLPIPLPNFR